MDKGANQKEKFMILEWMIKNFSCWRKEIHGVSIKCAPQTIPGLDIILYPRGMNGEGDRLSVLVMSKNHGGATSLLSGELSLFLSNGTEVEIWRNRMNFPKDVKYVDLRDWPKYFDDVLHKISEKSDTIALQYRTSSHTDTVERVFTTIFKLEKYFVLTPDKLVGLGSMEETLGSLQWELDDRTEECMDLRGDADPSKICLQLVPTRLKKSVFVLTRGVSKQTYTYIFGCVQERWVSAKLARKEVAEMQCVFIYYVKVVPSKSPEVSWVPPEGMDQSLAEGMIAGRGRDLSTNLVNSVKAKYRPNCPNSASVSGHGQGTSTNPGNIDVNRPNWQMYGNVSGHGQGTSMNPRNTVEDRPNWPTAACATGGDQQNYGSLASNEDVLGLAAIRQLGEQANTEGDSNEKFPPRMPPSTEATHVGKPSSFPASQFTNIHPPVVPDIWDPYIRYQNDPGSWTNLIELYSAAVQHGIQDLVQQLSAILSSKLNVFNMCDALYFAIRLKDPFLLREVHHFFVDNRSQVLRSPQWRYFENVHSRLAAMFLAEFSQS